MNAPASQHEHLVELLADQALGVLGTEQEFQLDGLVASGYADEDFSLTMTAAVLEITLFTAQDFQPMPAAVRLRLEAAGAAWAAVTSRANGAGALRGRPMVPRYVIRAWSPWLAAAACLTLAGIAWWSRTGRDLVAITEHDPNKVVVQLAAWNDPGASAPAPSQQVHGSICWSEGRQCGYLKLDGLPVNDCEHQYQVWIIDDRGMDQRISAGIFDCKGGECVVPIQPAIPIHDAKAFAITMEKPGGTWVSDMSHKVAIARCGKH